MQFGIQDKSKNKGNQPTGCQWLFGDLFHGDDIRVVGVRNGMFQIPEYYEYNNNNRQRQKQVQPYALGILIMKIPESFERIVQYRSLLLENYSVLFLGEFFPDGVAVHG